MKSIGSLSLDFLLCVSSCGQVTFSTGFTHRAKRRINVTPGLCLYCPIVQIRMWAKDFVSTTIWLCGWDKSGLFWWQFRRRNALSHKNPHVSWSVPKDCANQTSCILQDWGLETLHPNVFLGGKVEQIWGQMEESLQFWAQSPPQQDSHLLQSSFVVHLILRASSIVFSPRRQENSPDCFGIADSLLFLLNDSDIY